MNQIEESKDYDSSHKLESNTPKIQYLVLETERAPLKYQDGYNPENAIKIKNSNKLNTQNSLDGKKKIEQQNTRLMENNYLNKVRNTQEDKYQSELIQEESKLIK